MNNDNATVRVQALGRPMIADRLLGALTRTFDGYWSRLAARAGRVPALGDCFR